ncbi:MAG TPA: hypothetical protein VN229_08530 [Terriglobales bacterium]|nr:hypothetical protein [Terriglobales bacterium]
MGVVLRDISQETLKRLRLWAGMNSHSAINWQQFHLAAVEWQGILQLINLSPEIAGRVLEVDVYDDLKEAQAAFLEALGLVREMEAISQRLAGFAEMMQRGASDIEAPVAGTDGPLVNFLERRAERRSPDQMILDLIRVSNRLMERFADSNEEFRYRADRLKTALCLLP